MEQWLPILTLVLGYLLKGEFLGLTERGRLPGRIASQLDILEKLPEGPTRDELQRHIERHVRYLVAHEEPSTVAERERVRGASIVFLAAVGFGALMVSEEGPPSSAEDWVTFAIGLSFVLLSLWRLMSALDQRGDRRWRRLREAERGPAPGGGSATTP